MISTTSFTMSIFVAKGYPQGRQCGLGASFEQEMSILHDLNLGNYQYTTEVIQHLEKVIKGESPEYEWGTGERAWFTSNSQNTLIEDYFEWEENSQVPTSALLEIMIARKEFMEHWSQTRTKEEIRLAFEKVKINPRQYLEEAEAQRYKTLDTKQNILIRMIITQEDFLLAPEDFVATLTFNDRFFIAKDLI